MPEFNVTLLVAQGAPFKPAVGTPCNGCGVCCLLEPCPLGGWLSRKREGACDALRWDESTHTYRCGAVTHTDEVLRARWPKPLAMMLPMATWLVSRLAARWVAVGVGCDCDVQTSLQQECPGPVGDRSMQAKSIHVSTPT